MRMFLTFIGDFILNFVLVQPFSQAGRANFEDLVTRSEDLVTRGENLVTLNEDMFSRSKGLIIRIGDLIILSEEMVTPSEDPLNLMDLLIIYRF